VVREDDRWGKKNIAEAVAEDNELSTFGGWVRDGLLPLNSNDLTRYDPVLKALHAQWERFKVSDGILYRKYWTNDKEGDIWQLVAPVGYRNEIMSTAHASVTGGHMGVKKTQMKVAKKTYCVGWSTDVRDFWRRCNVCAKYHRGTTKNRANFKTCALAHHGKE